VRPARVLMSETTRDALAGDVEVIDYEPLQLKGMTTKQPIFQLSSPLAGEVAGSAEGAAAEDQD